MSNTFSFEEASQPAPAAGGDQAPKTFSFEEASGKPAPKGFMGHARDLGISALQGAIGVPEMAVGLADIPTGGAVGKFLENKDGAVGFRPKQAREFLDTLKTDATQQQKTEFEQADGVMGKAGYALSNPSLISNAVAESLPVMGAGGLIGRGVMAAAPKLGAAVAAGAGEGVAAAGSTAEQIRQETKDGELTAGQSALALGAGAATGAFGVAGAKVAKKLGIADADALLVQGSKGMAADAAQQAAMKSIPRKVIEGAIAEGFLEELPQSASEQIIQNIALDRPWSDGVESSVVLGVLSGMAMGGGATLVQGSAQRKADDGSPAGEQDAPQDAPPLALPAPTYTGTPNDQMLQAEAERANAVAEAEARAAGIYQQRADFEAAKQGQPEQPPVNAGLELVRQAYAAQLDALQQQEQDRADVPQSAPPDGRAALEAQAAQAQAQREADRAVMGPDDEILQSTGADQPPHRAMGIDPAAGPLSAGAAIAVDTGVAGQMQAAAQAVTAQSQPAGTEKEAQPAPSSPGELRPNAADAVQAAVSDAAARAAQAGLPMPEGKAVVEQAAQDQITRSTPDLVRQFADTAAKDPAIMRRVAAGTPEQMDAAMALAVPANAPQRDRLMRNDGFASAMRQALQGVAANPAARWDSMFGPEREALAGSLGLPPVIARNIPRAKWATLNPDLQARISKAMAPAVPDSAPSIEGADLGNGWAKFSAESGTAGVPRAEMPQIKAEHRGAMTNFMNARGVSHTAEEVPADSLRPTQAEFSPEKVRRAAGFKGGDRSILVSADNYVLDGHHQWLASRESGEPVKVIRLNAPIADLIPLAREFPSSTLSKGSKDGQTADLQDNARLAAQGGAQGRADVHGGAGDLVQRPDGAAGPGMGAASAGPVRGGPAPEPAGAAGGGRDAVSRAVQVLMDRTDGVGSPDGLSGPENADARTEIVAALTGKTVEEVSASPSAKLDTSVPRIERLLYDVAGIPAGEIKGRRSAFLDWLDSRDQVPIKNETRADTGPATDATPGDQESVKKLTAEPVANIKTAKQLDAWLAENVSDPYQLEAETPEGTLKDQGVGYFSLEKKTRIAYGVTKGRVVDDSDVRNVFKLKDGRLVWWNYETGDVLPVDPADTRYSSNERYDKFIDRYMADRAEPTAKPMPNPLEMTPKQYFEARMRWIADDYGMSMADVRESYDNEGFRDETDSDWVNSVRQAFKDGAELTRATLDKLEEIRPGAFGSFLHDHPNAKVPNGYQTPVARKAENEAADDKRADRRKAAEQRAADSPAVGNAPSPLEALFSDLNSESTRKANKAKKAAAKLPEAARIEYVQANFHDILIQMMEAGALEVNGSATLTEDNTPCL